MTYIYDILVNLSEELIDFYDWDKEDEFSHIRKVPLFKVNKTTLGDLTYRKVKVDINFLNSIKDKTQMFCGRNVEVIPYASIFCDGVNAVMVVFDRKGYVKERSKFLINEEEEIIDLTNSIRNSNILYNVLNKNYKINKMIRSDKKIVNDILNELDLIKDDKEKIDYLYYEWFDNMEGYNKYEKLVSDIKRIYTDKHKELLNIINLITVKK